MRVTSREYRVIVDCSLLADVDAALSDILDDVGNLARAVGLGVREKFDAKDPNERTILFLLQGQDKRRPLAVCFVSSTGQIERFNFNRR